MVTQRTTLTAHRTVYKEKLDFNYEIIFMKNSPITHVEVINFRFYFIARS